MALEFKPGTEGKYFEFRVRGLLDKEEYVEALQAAEALVEGKGRIRVCVLLEDFEGWGQGDWDDDRINRYLTEHDGDIERIAFVGEARWKEEILAFSGHPYTEKEVRFFEPSEADAARTWLASVE